MNKMTDFIKLQKFCISKMAENAVDDKKYEVKINSMNGTMHFLKFQTTDVPVVSPFQKSQRLMSRRRYP